MGPALQGIFVGQGPCALPGVRGKTGRRGEGTPPYGVRGKECLRYRRADRGVRPYGWFARSLWGGRPRGSPLRTGTRSACVIGGRGRTPPLRVRGKECLRGSRADRGVRPYGWFARSLWGGRPRGSPLRTGTRSACVIGGRGRTPPLRSAWQGVPAWNPPVSFADSPL